MDKEFWGIFLRQFAVPNSKVNLSTSPVFESQLNFIARTLLLLEPCGIEIIIFLVNWFIKNYEKIQFLSLQL